MTKNRKGKLDLSSRPKEIIEGKSSRVHSGRRRVSLLEGKIRKRRKFKGHGKGPRQKELNKDVKPKIPTEKNPSLPSHVDRRSLTGEKKEREVCEVICENNHWLRLRRKETSTGRNKVRFPRQPRRPAFLQYNKKKAIIGEGRREGEEKIFRNELVKKLLNLN